MHLVIGDQDATHADGLNNYISPGILYIGHGIRHMFISCVQWAQASGHVLHGKHPGWTGSFGWVCSVNMRLPTDGLPQS